MHYLGLPSSGDFDPARQTIDPATHLCSVPKGVTLPGPMAAIQYQRTREMTIDEIMLENRVVFLVGEINHVSAARVMMQMLYLEDQKRGQEINLYINSPGGAVDDTLALYDTMQFISSSVATYCIGRAYSGGAVLLCAGTQGRRHILPHAKVMIHQPYGGVTGQTTDVQIQAEQIIKAKRTLNEIIARHTGKTFMLAEDYIWQGRRARPLLQRRRSEGVRPGR